MKVTIHFHSPSLRSDYTYQEEADLMKVGEEPRRWQIFNKSEVRFEGSFVIVEKIGDIAYVDIVAFPVVSIHYVDVEND